MFSREIDWRSAIKVICDIMRGSSALSVESHSSRLVGDRRVAEASKWRYEQAQSFQSAESRLPRLFSLNQLEDMLVAMSKADFFHAYEEEAGSSLTPDVAGSLAEFSSIEVSLVTLTVGDVTMSWVLVSLGQPRDLILWKMRYHLRDARL